MRCDEVRRSLTDYVEGVLPLEQAQVVEAHLQGCPDCAHELQMLQRVPQVLRQWSPPVPSERIWAGIESRIRARRWQPRRYALIATLSAAAAALLLAFFIWQRATPAYPPVVDSYARYWQAHREWAQNGGAGELYPYVEAQ